MIAKIHIKLTNGGAEDLTGNFYWLDDDHLVIGFYEPQNIDITAMKEILIKPTV